MVEFTDRAAQALDGTAIRAVRLEREDDPGELPSPERVVPDREADEVTDDQVAQAYRKLFWSFDVDPTKRRPAGEALARRLTGGALPQIHPLVDALNLASAATLVPLSVFDENHLTGPLVLDLSDPGEQFEPIGESEPMELDGDHPVWRDDQGPVSLACYRDGKRTALGEDTSRAIAVTLGPQALATRVIPEAFRKLESYASIAGWRFAQPVQETRPKS